MSSKFCILNPKNSRGICPWILIFFSKSRLISNIFYCFSVFVNNCVYISKSKWCFNVKSSVYCFHMKTKMLVNFQICIGIPLKEKDLMPLLWTSTRNRQTYKIHSRNWNLILLAVNTLMLRYLGNWLRLRGNDGQTNNIPGGNAWKFRAFLIAFPTMILRMRFVAFFMNAMLILTLSSLSLCKIKSLA